MVSRYLGLLKLLVIVSLQFDQWAKDVLVLVGVLVAQQHMLGFLVHTGFLQVFQGGTGVVLGGNAVTASVHTVHHITSDRFLLKLLSHKRTPILCMGLSLTALKPVLAA